MTPPDFTVTLTDRGADTVVVVAGELDMLTAPDLAATLEGVVGTGDVVVDLSGVTFIDSTALQTVMRAERVLGGAGRSLRLEKASSIVLRVLDLTGLTHHFDQSVRRRDSPAPRADADSTRDALRAILNDLALRLLTESSLRGDLDRLIRLTCDTIPPCCAASIAVIIDGRPSTVAVNDHVALELDLAQYEHREGPCLDALHGRPIRVDVLATDERFTHFARGVADHRVNSVLSMPITRHDDVIGTLNLYADDVNAFGDADADTARVAAAQAAHAIVRSEFAAGAHELRDRLQAAYDGAALTARAEGILIALHACSSDQARHMLENATAATGSTLVATAQRVLDAAGGAPPPPS